jgi:hypothetical protein
MVVASKVVVIRGALLRFEYIPMFLTVLYSVVSQESMQYIPSFSASSSNIKDQNESHRNFIRFFR